MAEVAYLSLGSNVGEREAYLAQAVEMLASAEVVELLACSALYETEPVGEVTEQRPFLNIAVKLLTDLDPMELLRLCKQSERAIGRTPAVKDGPREIDIDLILFGNRQETLVSDSGFGDGYTLVLPHPRMPERRFVLVPLAEVEPDLILPGGVTVAEALEAVSLDNQQVEKVGTVALSS